MSNDQYEHRGQIVKLEGGLIEITESGRILLLSKMTKNHGPGWELYNFECPTTEFRLTPDSQPQETEIDVAILMYRRLKK